MRQTLSAGYRTARRIAIAVIGGTVALVGLALLVLPGPALLVIPAGLALLALEFAWARRWLEHARNAANNHAPDALARVSGWARRKARRAARWVGLGAEG